MIINRAKLELMEAAIRHLGGEIILVPRKEFVYHEAVLESQLVWRIARKRNDKSGNFEIKYLLKARDESLIHD